MPRTDDEEGGGTAKKVGWFVALWAGGVLAVTVVGLAIRAWLG